MMDIAALRPVIESLLAGKGVDAFELYLTSSRTLAVDASDGRIETYRVAAPSGVALRVLKNQGLGFSFATAFEESALRTMVDGALTGAEYQTPDENHCIPEAGPYAEIQGLRDERLHLIPEEQKVRQALELERMTKAADPRIRKVRKASYAEGSWRVELFNSLGFHGSYEATHVSASVSVVAEAAGDSQMGWEYRFGRRYEDLPWETVAREGAARAAALLGGVKIPTMSCPAVLDSYVSVDILEVLAQSFLAEQVQKGKSLLKDRIGQSIISPLITIHDDGTLPTGAATAPFDGEGVAMRDTVLIKGGTLQGYLYDCIRARRGGAAVTGNSVREGIKSPPRMGVTNLFIQAGNASREDLLQGIDRGILVTDVMGIHTANPISGDFSVGASGFLIENGTVTTPVTGIAVSGNLLDLFRSVEQVGSDLRFYGRLGAPSLRVSRIDVSGT